MHVARGGAGNTGKCWNVLSDDSIFFSPPFVLYRDLEAKNMGETSTRSNVTPGARSNPRRREKISPWNPRLDFPSPELPLAEEPDGIWGKPPSVSLPVDDLWTVFSAGCTVLWRSTDSDVVQGLMAHISAPRTAFIIQSQGER